MWLSEWCTAVTEEHDALDGVTPMSEADQPQNGLPRNGLPRHGPRQRRLPQTTLGLIVLNFVPSWFAVNMGTGILSTLLYTCPHQFTGLKFIAVIFYLLNILLFVTFGALTVARNILHPWVFNRMLRHPQHMLVPGDHPHGPGNHHQCDRTHCCAFVRQLGQCGDRIAMVV